MKRTILLFIIVVLTTACGAREGWRAVEIGSDVRCDSLHAVSAQGSPLRCSPWMPVHYMEWDVGTQF